MVNVCVYVIVVCEVRLCCMCCSVVKGGGVFVQRAACWGEGAWVGPGGDVHVVVPCSKFCISADSVSSIVSMPMLCCWSSRPCLCICRSRTFRL